MENQKNKYKKLLKKYRLNLKYLQIKIFKYSWNLIKSENKNRKYNFKLKKIFMIYR